MGRLWLRLAYGAVKLFFRLCCQVHIEGSEHIPSQGGVVLVSNHISAFDTVLLPYSVLATQGMQIIWAPAKAELFRSRLLGYLLTPLGVFPVRRGQHDRQAMRRMIAHMRTEKMMLFPEGTRSRDGRLHEGKRTVGKLIYTARPVVIPARNRRDRAHHPASQVPRAWPYSGVRALWQTGGITALLCDARHQGDGGSDCARSDECHRGTVV